MHNPLDIKKEINDPHEGMQITSAVNHEIMSKIRSMDYQHPGETEAIEIVFKDVKRDKNHLLLDVGCGRGGTAHYLQHQGWGQVIGIDINKDVVQVANNKYSSSNDQGALQTPLFLNGDVIAIEQILKSIFKAPVLFDVIYLLNSFFLFPDHRTALLALKSVSKASTNLIVFDYVNYGHYDSQAHSENGKALIPNAILWQQIDPLFTVSGWKVSSAQKIDSLYIQWYQALMAKIEKKRPECVEQYGKAAFDCFTRRYQHILDALTDGSLGGVIITAKQINSAENQ